MSNQKNQKSGNKDSKPQDSKSKAKGLKNLINHPEWYTRYDNSVLVNLNYGIRNDIPVRGGTSGRANEGVPAIMVLYADVTIPVQSTDVSIPADLTASRAWKDGVNYLYVNARAANSSLAKYDPKVLSRYIQSVRVLHVFQANLRKLYATLLHFSSSDSRIPEAYFTAQGYNYADWVAHMADIRSFGYRTSQRLSKLYPIKMDLLERTYWMFSNYFADSDDAKAAVYTFQPITRVHDANSQIFSTQNQEVVNSKGEYFTWTPESIPLDNPINTLMTFDQYVFLYESLIDWLGRDTVFSDIASELMKAYGPSWCIPVEVWKEDADFPVVYDEAALTQIQNSVPVGTNAKWYDSEYGTLYSYGTQASVSAIPQNNQPITTLAATFIAGGANDRCYINTYKNSMTPGETMSAMRLYNRFIKYENKTLVATNYGTEVVKYGIVYFGVGRPDASGGVEQCMRIAPIGINYTFIDEDTLGDMSTGINKLRARTGDWSAFDWAPRYSGPIVIHTNGTPSLISIGVDMWDWNNYAICDSSRTIESIQEMANLSLLYVQGIRSQSKFTSK